MIVHQFVADPRTRRGRCAHADGARRAARGRPHVGDLHVGRSHAPVHDRRARSLRDVPRAAPTLLVYQMAIGSPVADCVLGRHEPLVVNHHNLTPLRYLAGWRAGRRARRGVGTRAAPRARRRARDARHRRSRSYNEADLIEAGLTRDDRRAVPARPRLDSRSNPIPTIARTPTQTTWLFVGPARTRTRPNTTRQGVRRVPAVP